MHKILSRLQRPRVADRGRAVAEERMRIARELHDVVAHSVSEMVVQASGVRCQLRADQGREREALQSVEKIGHEALSELRRMVGVMQLDGDAPSELTPQPGLAHLDRLVARFEQEGLPIKLRVEGERPDLSTGIDLSAYRIVQESLANTLKHANGAPTEVVVRYTDDSVEVEINGSGRAEGQGLVGMRERVALCGGTLETGPRNGSGFVVRAQLPVEARG